MSDLNLAINIAAVDLASSTLKNIGSAISSLASGNVAGAASGVGLAIAGIGVAAVGVAAQSIKMAGDFQSGMTSLVTGAGEAQSNIAMVSNGILDMAASTGASTSQLTNAMYEIESSGMHGSSGLRVLQAAAQGARVGAADLGVTANSLTTILTDYHMSSDQATSATNGLIATVASGKTHLQDLASSMGSVLPLASSLGISFPQVAGGIATMTNAGMDAQRASQNLANAIRSLAAPNSSAVKSMTAVGLSAQDLKDTLSNQGLASALQLVEDHVGKKFPAGSVEAVESFKKIMGGATGYNVALMLGGRNMQSFQGNIAGISKAMDAGGTSVTGWNLVQQDWNQKMAQGQQAVNVLMIRLGMELMPVLGDLMAKTAPIILAISDWATKNHILEKAIAAAKTAISDTVMAVQKIIEFVRNAITVIQEIYQWFVRWHQPIVDTATALLVFFAPALISAGVQATIAGVKIAAGFVAQLVTTGVEAIVNGVKVTASFVASMITAGAEAWVQGPRVLAGFVASMITAGVQAVVSAAKVTASFVASMATTAAQAVATGAVIAAKFVWSLITAAAQAVATGATFIASLVPALISVVAEATVAAVTAIPGLVIGFGAWVVGAGAAAIATIAATWPILAIIAAVALLIAGIVLLVTHWSQVTAFLQSTWQNFTTWLMGALQAIGAFFVNIWHGIQTFLSAAWDFIVNAARVAAMVLLAVIIGPIGLLVIFIIQHWTQISQFLQNAWNTLIGVASAAWSMISNAIQNGFNAAVGFVKNVWTAIQGVFQAAWNTYIAQPLADLWASATSAFAGFAADAVSFGVNIVNSLVSGIQSVIGNVGATISNGVNGALGAVGIHLPGHAQGILNSPTGHFAAVGENGPEIMYVPQGSSIFPNGSLMGGSGGAPSGAGGGGGTTINLTINVPGRSRNEAQEIARMVHDQLSRELRRSGNMITQTSGGRS